MQATLSYIWESVTQNLLSFVFSQFSEKLYKYFVDLPESLSLHGILDHIKLHNVKFNIANVTESLLRSYGWNIRLKYGHIEDANIHLYLSHSQLNIIIKGFVLIFGPSLGAQHNPTNRKEKCKFWKFKEERISRKLEDIKQHLSEFYLLKEIDEKQERLETLERLIKSCKIDKSDEKHCEKAKDTEVSDSDKLDYHSQAFKYEYNELVRQMEEMKAPKSSSTGVIMQWLLRYVPNIKMKLEDVYLRYEDDAVQGDHSVAWGIHCGELILQPDCYYWELDGSNYPQKTSSRKKEQFNEWCKFDDNKNENCPGDRLIYTFEVSDLGLFWDPTAAHFVSETAIEATLNEERGVYLAYEVDVMKQQIINSIEQHYWVLPSFDFEGQMGLQSINEDRERFTKFMNCLGMRLQLHFNKGVTININEKVLKEILRTTKHIVYYSFIDEETRSLCPQKRINQVDSRTTKSKIIKQWWKYCYKCVIKVIRKGKRSLREVINTRIYEMKKYIHLIKKWKYEQNELASYFDLDFNSLYNASIHNQDIRFLLNLIYVRPYWKITQWHLLADSENTYQVWLLRNSKKSSQFPRSKASNNPDSEMTSMFWGNYFQEIEVDNQPDNPKKSCEINEKAVYRLNCFIKTRHRIFCWSNVLEKYHKYFSTVSTCEIDLQQLSRFKKSYLKKDKIKNNYFTSDTCVYNADECSKNFNGNNNKSGDISNQVKNEIPSFLKQIIDGSGPDVPAILQKKKYNFRINHIIINFGLESSKFQNDPRSFTIEVQGIVGELSCLRTLIIKLLVKDIDLIFIENCDKNSSQISLIATLSSDSLRTRRLKSNFMKLNNKSDKNFRPQTFFAQFEYPIHSIKAPKDLSDLSQSGTRSIEDSSQFKVYQNKESSSEDSDSNNSSGSQCVKVTGTDFSKDKGHDKISQTKFYLKLNCSNFSNMCYALQSPFSLHSDISVCNIKLEVSNRVVQALQDYLLKYQISLMECLSTCERFYGNKRASKRLFYEGLVKSYNLAMEASNLKKFPIIEEITSKLSRIDNEVSQQIQRSSSFEKIGVEPLSYTNYEWTINNEYYHKNKIMKPNDTTTSASDIKNEAQWKMFERGLRDTVLKLNLRLPGIEANFIEDLENSSVKDKTLMELIKNTTSGAYNIALAHQNFAFYFGPQQKFIPEGEKSECSQQIHESIFILKSNGIRLQIKSLMRAYQRLIKTLEIIKQRQNNVLDELNLSFPVDLNWKSESCDHDSKRIDLKLNTLSTLIDKAMLNLDYQIPNDEFVNVNVYERQDFCNSERVPSNKSSNSDLRTKVESIKNDNTHSSKPFNINNPDQSISYSISKRQSNNPMFTSSAIVPECNYFPTLRVGNLTSFNSNSRPLNYLHHGHSHICIARNNYASNYDKTPHQIPFYKTQAQFIQKSCNNKQPKRVSSFQMPRIIDPSNNRQLKSSSFIVEGKNSQSNPQKHFFNYFKHQ